MINREDEVASKTVYVLDMRMHKKSSKNSQRREYNLNVKNIW
jgi:hypothetical protein